MKICPRCESKKPLEAFASHAWCRECTKEYNRERRQKPEIKAKEKEQSKKWMAEHPGYQNKWSKENRAKRRGYEKKHFLKNPQKRRDIEKNYRKNNKDKMATWPCMSREVRIKAERKYVNTHREIIRAKVARYRISRKNVEGSHTLEEWAQKCKEYNYKCAYCGKIPKIISRDHVIPISKGGTDYISNLIPACRSCNSKKRNRTYQEYMAILSI